MTPLKKNTILLILILGIFSCSKTENKETKQEELELNKVDELIKKDQEKMDSFEKAIKKQMED